MTHGDALFGRPVRRREDLTLMRGTGAFLADLIRPGMIAMHLIRSSVAHGRILAIDGSRVTNHPDCLGFWGAADLPPLRALPAFDLGPDSAPVHQSVLANGTARYAGEPVAVLFARDATLAQDLAEEVVVTYEALPAMMDAVAASHDGAPLLYPALGRNVVHETTQHVGDPDAAFAAAAAIIEQSFPFHRAAASPMEPRGTICTIEPETGRFVLQSSTQIPQVLRDELAAITGIDRARLRVVAPRIGGGFGSKEAVYPEEVLVLLAARHFGQPVFWLEDRSEHFQSTVHGREEVMHVRAALAADGTITAIEADCVADIGAAYALFGNTPGAAVAMVRGPYRIPNFRARGRSVVTNKTPLNVYRGAGYPQAILAMERIMDMAAARLGMDRAAIRHHNLLQTHEFPVDRAVAYPGVCRVVFDSGDFPACLDTALEAIDYAGFPVRRAAAGPALWLGLGLSFVVEMTALGSFEPSRLQMRADGRLRLLSGVTAIGQGSETTLLQILADRLGVPPSMIEIVSGDTDDAPDAPGTFASRGATMGGNAACLAADEFIGQARALAAELRAVPLESIAWDKGLLIERAGRNEPLALRDLLAQAEAAGLDPLLRLDARATFTEDRIAYASGCHAAVVAIDPATGVTRVLDYAVAHDCGRVANPMLVDGQIMGGVMQGLGATLFETMAYDAQGLPLVKGFWDYILPTAATSPRFVLRHLETPSPLNPLGMKGCGEAGCSGAAAAIANAIADALGPLGSAANGSGPFTPPFIRDVLRKASQETIAC